MTLYILKKFAKSGQLKGHGELRSDEDGEVIAWAARLPAAYTYELWCGDRLLYDSRPSLTATADPAEGRGTAI